MHLFLYSMKLIITRHGETEENLSGILQGHLPGTLSAEGIRQAEKVALRLKTETFDYIYSSDLNRAADTAKKIVEFHPGTRLEFVQELRERCYGEFQGKKKSDLGWGTNDTHTVRIQPKNGETIQDVYRRAELFFQRMMVKHQNDSVLFVCHFDIGRALIAVITGKKHTEVESIEGLGNTSITSFEIYKSNKYKMTRFNCTRHLFS